jgi:cytochrome P450
VEFNEQIARPLPGSVVLKLLGMSDDYLEQLQGWASATVIALGSNQPRLEWLDAYEDAVIEMEAIFEMELAKRRENPTPDLITDLMQASEDGDKLTHDELIGALIQIIIAGHESTTGSITLALAALARHPDHWRDLAAHPEKALPAAIELMRYSAMSAAMGRVVAEDFQWDGQLLKRGQLVMLMIAGGNRDPSVYPEPEKLDFSRTNYETLTFGPGLHHCIGHLLAKMQVSELLAAVTQRFEGAELLEELDFMPQIIFRGVHHLNLRFLPRG